ncbi:MAG: hypothetical protein ACP5M9_00705 [Candidatus Micrarchaeia archaeon]
MNFRIKVQTNLGTFLCTPVQTAAKVDLEHGKEYIHVGDLRKGDQVYVSKTVSEKITLEDHIIPTLWSSSEFYRKDRGQLFRIGTTEVPNETLLSYHLNKILYQHGERSDAAKIIHNTIKLMPENLHYSYSAVVAWLNNEVMFPEKPEVLLKLADTFNAPSLKEWTLSVLNQDQMSVKRLRVIHSQIRARLAKPIGSHEEYSILKNNESEGKKNNSNEHIDIGSFVGLIRKEYGKDLLKEFVTVAQVTEDPLQVSDKLENTSEFSTSSNSTGLSRKIIGFSYTKPEERLTVISKHGTGMESSKRLEFALLKRNELAILLIKRFFEISAQIEPGLMAKHNYDLKRNYTLQITMFSNALLFNHTVNFHLNDINTCKLITSSKKFRECMRHILSITDKDDFYEKLNFYYKKFNSVASLYFIQYMNEIYNKSLIEKFVLSREEFFSIFNIDMYGLKNNLSKFLNSIKALDKQGIEKLNKNIDETIKYFKLYDRIYYDSKFNEILKELRNLNIPIVFRHSHQAGSIKQDNLELIKKIMVAYGIYEIPKLKLHSSIPIEKNSNKIDFLTFNLFNQ